MSKESKDVANILELTPVQIEKRFYGFKPVDQLYNNEVRLSTFDKILATAALMVIEDPLSNACYDVLYFIKSMLPFFLEKQMKRVQEGKLAGPTTRAKLSNMKPGNVDLSHDVGQIGAISSLTRMTVHQASTAQCGKTSKTLPFFFKIH